MGVAIKFGGGKMARETIKKTMKKIGGSGKGSKNGGRETKIL
ncbi:MAG: hypothetical protein PHC43_05155 [Candidatus Marinimicrobia bacterium]|nr:hypothetical protein [Candidatus Neomarinimicrobiota bacterium]